MSKTYHDQYVGIHIPWQGRHDLGPDQLDHSMVKTKTDYYNRPIGLYKHCTTGMTNSKVLYQNGLFHSSGIGLYTLGRPFEFD
jgi:hypothetical protein